jgi:hypothetical protein
MNYELIPEKNWLKRNWKWFLPTILLSFSLSIGLFINSNIDKNIVDFAQAYTDNSLYEKAIEKAKSNQRVLEVLGNLEPIDPLAIMEGNAKYSNNSNSVALSVRIKGNKGGGKMDILADKNGTEWEYKKISIRIKQTKEEIQIIE